jgi:pimeloyl-ACP methyl ester carboxylesterase
MEGSVQAATVTIGDVELYYETHGSGEPLLFLHGFTGCGSDWKFIGKELAAERQVIAPDLRGHGRSTNPSPNFLFRDAARDVRGLLKTLGLPRVKGVGLSGGGITLMHMALQDPACIESMILVSAPPYFPDEARAIMRAVPQEPQNSSDWANLRERHPRGDTQIAALMRQARGFADSYDDVAFTPEQLQKIGAETLVVFGDRDPLYPVRLAVELRASIPRSFLWVVPNGGHGPVFGPLAAPFLQTAQAFLSGSWRQ